MAMVFSLQQISLALDHDKKCDRLVAHRQDDCHIEHGLNKASMDGPAFAKAFDRSQAPELVAFEVRHACERRPLLEHALQLLKQTGEVRSMPHRPDLPAYEALVDSQLLGRGVCFGLR